MSDDKYREIVSTGFDTWGSAYDRQPTHKAVPVDAIVIERDALSEVYEYATNLVANGYPVDRNADPDEVERNALAHLALAEYLRANPPVDEAQVKAVTAALYEATSDPYDIDVPDVARRLVQAGVRVPEVKK